MKRIIVALTSMAILAGACAREESNPITNGQGEIAGEVTTESVILQSRLTMGDALVDGDLPGAKGIARFEVATSMEFVDSLTTGWLRATSEHDFIVKAKLDGLDAGTRYYYRLGYGPTEDRTTTGPTRTFKTLDGSTASTEVSFVAVTGMNYHRFHHTPNRAYKGSDKDLGYPALVTILESKPDFFVATGDNVYYDVPYKGRAETAAEMRKKWHEQLVQPRYIDLFAQVPTYWEKDDHDSRYNDSDNTRDAEPSPELGAAIFLEQVPVADPSSSSPVTYRTHRINKLLQIWLTEGRDHVRTAGGSSSMSTIESKLAFSSISAMCLRPSRRRKGFEAAHGHVGALRWLRRDGIRYRWRGPGPMDCRSR